MTLELHQRAMSQIMQPEVDRSVVSVLSCGPALGSSKAMSLEDYKGEIFKHYNVEKKTLKQVIEILKELHGVMIT